MKWTAMNSRPTNQVTRLRTIARWASGTLAVAAAALLISCVTTGVAKKQEALVCPQCRMVKVANVSSQPGGRYPGFPQSRFGGNYAGTTCEHRCEGCQGTLITFFREGKFQHKCSICKETPFTCPVIYPNTARL